MDLRVPASMLKLVNVKLGDLYTSNILLPSQMHTLRWQPKYQGMRREMCGRV